MSVLLAAVQARGTSKIHLTPGEVNAIWHLTRYVGQSFWHLTAWAQVTIAAVPSVPGSVWLWRWEALPVATDAEVRRWRGEEIRGSRRRGIG